MSESRDQLLEELRPRSFAIAYRMLGSVAEAEDVVQESLVRLVNAMDGDGGVDSPRAYLATVTTRLAIDQLRSARVRREVYTGEWLPEPIVQDSSSDPATQVEMADSLSLAFLVLLESLSPEQRAALLLHDVFDYDYSEVAGIIDKSEANTRQLTARARKHVEAKRPRFETSEAAREELARKFFAAVEEGEIGQLETLLAHDIELHGDGGGKVPALARSLHGRNRVARTLTAWFRHSRKVPGGHVRIAQVNGQPGACLMTGERELISVMSLDIRDGRVQAIRSIVNPDKLQHLGPVVDLGTVLRGSSTDS